MTYKERLEGTEVEWHWLARCICGFLDGLESMGVMQFPSVRSLCVVADACRTDGKSTSTKTVSKMLAKMDEVGVLSLIIGKGRNTNAYDIPKDGNLLADKMAKYKIKVEQYEKEMRKAAEEDLKRGVIDVATLNRMIADFTAHDEDWNCYFERDVIAGKAKRYNAGMQYNRNKNRYIPTEKRREQWQTEKRREQWQTEKRREQWQTEKRREQWQTEKRREQWLEEKTEREKVVERHANMVKDKEEKDRLFDEWMIKKGYETITPDVVEEFKKELHRENR